jgi:ATP-binding cassette subfamily C protein
VSYVSKLIKIFGRRTLLKGILVLGFIVSSTMLEMVGIGMIFPFLQLLASPETALENAWLKRLYEGLAVSSTDVFVIYLGVSLILFMILKSLYLIGATYLSQRIVQNERARLSGQLFSAYLAMPWEFHITHNSASLVSNTIKAVDTMFGDLIAPLLLTIADGLLVAAICALLLVFQPTVTLLVVGVLVALIGIFYGLFQRSARSWGRQVQDNDSNMIQVLNEGLGSLKELKVSGRESFFLDRFSRNSYARARASALLQSVVVVPRHFIEGVMVFGLLIVLVFYQSRGEPLQAAIPTLGLFALAAFRIVPSLSRLGNGFITMKYGSAALEQIYMDVVAREDKALSRDLHAEPGAIRFENCLRLENVSVAYPGRTVKALSDVSLTIARGESIAVVGASGCGKTTLVDLILGILSPSSGKVFVDEIEVSRHLKDWQRMVGYVPQTIYLSDDSVRKNIAFAIPESEIDNRQVEQALELAGLADVVNDLPEGPATRVGERGVNLSGGQRQRVGIARALYGKPRLLVLDEATSALDRSSEHRITLALQKLKESITMIIIAHRLDTIRWCDRIVFMQDGYIAAIGRYEFLVESNEDFRRFILIDQAKATA